MQVDYQVVRPALVDWLRREADEPFLRLMDLVERGVEGPERLAVEAECLPLISAYAKRLADSLRLRYKEACDEAS
jgi:hypothetical protein